MASAVTLPLVCVTTPEARRRIAEGVRRVMSPMASTVKVWEIEKADSDGPSKYRIAGFEKKDQNTMKVTKLMDELSHDDLKSIYEKLHDHLHGDEHG